MTTAAARIASLDGHLVKRGEDVVLRRPASPSPFDQPCRALVRPGRPEELMSGILSGTEQMVTISPTGLGTWPDGAGPAVPRRGDVVVIDGREAVVQSARPTREAGVLVRIDLVVMGRVSG